MHEWPQGDLNELKDGIFGFLAICACAGIAIGGFSLAIRDAEQNCYRGTARTLDCDLFRPCNEVNGRPRIIDVELNYAKRHPGCRADWSTEKHRLAEEYWRTDGKNQ